MMGMPDCEFVDVSAVVEREDGPYVPCAQPI